MQAIKKLSVGINSFHVPHASRPVLSTIVRPALAERSEWLSVKHALKFYRRLALQHLCFEFHQFRALRKLEGTSYHSYPSGVRQRRIGKPRAKRW